MGAALEGISHPAHIAVPAFRKIVRHTFAGHRTKFSSREADSSEAERKRLVADFCLWILLHIALALTSIRRQRDITQSLFLKKGSGEILQPALFDGSAQSGHHLLIVIKVVQSQKDRAEHLSGAKKMMYIGAGPACTGRTGTGRIDRPQIIAM